MSPDSNNPPDVIIELSYKDANLLSDHCDSNMTLALQFLQTSPSAAGAREAVDLIEGMKRIKDAIVQGMKK